MAQADDFTLWYYGSGNVTVHAASFGAVELNARDELQ